MAKYSILPGDTPDDGKPLHEIDRFAALTALIESALDEWGSQGPYPTQDPIERAALAEWITGRLERSGVVSIEPENPESMTGIEYADERRAFVDDDE